MSEFKPLLLLVIVLGFLLTSCSSPSLSSDSSPVETPSSCQSFNKGDDLRTFLGTSSLQINAPLERRSDPNRGWSVVLLPTSDETIKIFWVWQNKQGDWAIAEKQTVVDIKPGLLNAELMHRLNDQIYLKKVLFITIPDSYWENLVTVQPVLEKTESRWGRLQYYPVQLSTQGISHPFWSLYEKGLSGDSLPKHLTDSMNQVELGSVYIPSLHKDRVELVNPTIAHLQLCPNSGS